jgi:hypothetical protein
MSTEPEQAQPSQSSKILHLVQHRKPTRAVGESPGKELTKERSGTSTAPSNLLPFLFKFRISIAED